MSGDRDDREEEGSEPSFKVIDRRRFASDGSERSEEEQAGVVETVRESPPPVSEAPPPPPPPQPPEPPAALTPEPEPELAAPQGEPYEGTAADAQPSFATLVLSLSTQALMCLGEIPEAPGAEPRQELGAARNIIDLLGVLEQKTKGNLTEDEHALLERILYDLRMRFVQLSGSAE
ncbi:MAG: DUF1844 domain-containing protein [Candidatus Binatia bacterium]|nr:DUF1844 domain-containing protein [Candidatus Binatia bacterium]